MSRAFVKDDADQERVLVPQRAPLADGVPNLVTPAGLELLRRERDDRLREREALAADPDATDRARRLTVLREVLEQLDDRLASARVVVPSDGDEDVATLGATVTVRYGDGQTSSFRIVGVDEADPLEGLVAFTAPIAAAVLDRRVGDEVHASVAGKDRSGTLVAVRYGD
ncbi:MAG: GreA/GreB family elongation factor [Trueperaceae bacterium]|nr:GreA/GreB family elongation factor [Trueperaceae bacterium]